MIDLKNKPTPEEILPFNIDEISKMSAFDLLWNCSKDHLSEVAITYSADLNVTDETKKPPVTKITYGQLIKNIIKTYHSLKELGVKKYDIITYAGKTTPELIYLAYASNLHGSIIDIIDPRLHTEDFYQHFQDEPSKLFFAPKPFFDQILPISNDLGVDKIIPITFQESLPFVVRMGAKLQNIKNKEERNKEEKLDPNLFWPWRKFYNCGSSEKIIPHHNFEREDPISLSHTTGTTGVPKGLLHSNENWNAQVYNAAHSGLDYRRGEKFFNCTVPWVDFGIINAVHIFLCNGIEMNLDPTWLPETNSDYLLKYKPQWWLGSPNWLDDLFVDEKNKYRNRSMENIRYIVTGGSALWPHKHELYQNELNNRGSVGKIVPGFGLSEASAAISTDYDNVKTTMGTFWPLVDTKIVDRKTGKTVPKGTEGEFYVGSKDDRLSQIALGYYNNPEETAETFVKDENGKTWVKSGDKVVENEDGSYTWLTRYKNILTYNSYNINCEKIIELVEKIPGVEKVVVIGCIIPNGNQMPIVCLETTLTDVNELKNTIYDIIAKKCPDYYKPKDIVIYDKLPTVSMKVDIRQIKAELLNENGEYVEPKKLSRY